MPSEEWLSCRRGCRRHDARLPGIVRARAARLTTFKPSQERDFEYNRSSSHDVSLRYVVYTCDKMTRTGRVSSSDETRRAAITHRNDKPGGNMSQYWTSHNITYYSVNPTHQLGSSCASLLGPWLCPYLTFAGNSLMLKACTSDRPVPGLYAGVGS